MQTIKTRLSSYVSAFVVSLCGHSPALSAPLKGEEKFTFETWSKQEVDGYRVPLKCRKTGTTNTVA